MRVNNTTNVIAPDKRETLPESSVESAQPSHRIAELIGVFENDPVWDAIMDEVRARREENERESEETTDSLTEIPALRK